MGFLEYARLLFFEKDQMKINLSTSSKTVFPQFFCDEEGSVIVLPEPKFRENEDGEKTIWLMGYCFPADAQGKRQLAHLFKASAFHLSAHAVSSSFKDYEEWGKSKDSRLVRFTSSLIEDAVATAYVSTKHVDKLFDLAFANTLALKRLHSIDKLINPATKIMADLLVRMNTGFTKVESQSEHNVAIRVAELLDQFKEKACLSSGDEKVNLKDEKLKVAEEIYCAIENAGPITEAPFLPHTEELGKCSIFSRSYFVDSDIILETDFKKCLDFLGDTFPSSEERKQRWRKTSEAEAIQVFNSWEHEKEKNEKMLAKYEDLLVPTRLRSAEIPQLSYTEFLRSKARCKSEAHRLIESLLVARDAVDEDPRKMYGVLDLAEVIQVIASKSPRLDVFMLDENISKSYAWIILLDASRSMRCIKDFALELFVMAAEAANQLLLDSSSWGMYAFNDRFLVIKDPKERYNVRVKSRIGGLKFEGFTYMPDALEIAGQIIKARNENLRLITVISDGWPFGYTDIESALSETISSLKKRNIAVLGIGAKSRRMKFFFKNHCTVYTLRDLKKKFSTLYMEASRIAVEA
ncbi:VWA domain-containing protein [Candidatus Bathyarchaeota archaeon]|nr:VWA domain-containing protein [Candidatus Bathyarchaeota archaeon]